jgi:cytochrome b561
MLSAAPHPIEIIGGLYLPRILSPDPVTYAWLRQLHTYLAVALFAIVVVHFGAALMHGLIRRDGVFDSMASWRR